MEGYLGEGIVDRIFALITSPRSQWLFAVVVTEASSELIEIVTLSAHACFETGDGGTFYGVRLKMVPFEHET